MFQNGEWQRALEALNRVIDHHNNQLRGREGTYWSIPHFSRKEFLIALALLIGAANCAEKEEHLWDGGRSSKKKWKKHWHSIVSATNFSRYMKLYRFKHFRRFYPKIFQDNNSDADRSNPWRKFSSAIRTFNQICKDLITTSEVIPIDESILMNQWVLFAHRQQKLVVSPTLVIY